MKLSRKEAVEILKQNSLQRHTHPEKYNKEVTEAIDTAIEALGETKLIKKNDVWTDEITFDHYLTECCKIGPITTEKFCPECGKKIIR